MQQKIEYHFPSFIMRRAFQNPMQYEEKNTLKHRGVNDISKADCEIISRGKEANGASSRKDFRNKIFICKKEAQETKHWLRMIVRCVPGKRGEVGKLWREAQELTLIFGKIVSTIDKKN